MSRHRLPVIQNRETGEDPVRARRCIRYVHAEATGKPGRRMNHAVSQKTCLTSGREPRGPGITHRSENTFRVFMV